MEGDGRNVIRVRWAALCGETFYAGEHVEEVTFPKGLMTPAAGLAQIRRPVAVCAEVEREKVFQYGADFSGFRFVGKGNEEIGESRSEQTAQKS